MNELSQVMERLTRIETKLDHMNEKFAGHDERIIDHETRLRRLERVVWIASGTALAGGGALGTIFSQLTS